MTLWTSGPFTVWAVSWAPSVLVSLPQTKYPAASALAASIGIQLLAAGGIAAYSFIVGFVLIKVIDKFSKVAVDPDTYAKGLDVSIHGHEAYFDSSSNGPRRLLLSLFFIIIKGYRSYVLKKKNTQ